MSTDTTAYSLTGKNGNFDASYLSGGRGRLFGLPLFLFLLDRMRSNILFNRASLNVRRALAGAPFPGLTLRLECKHEWDNGRLKPFHDIGGDVRWTGQCTRNRFNRSFLESGLILYNSRAAARAPVKLRLQHTALSLQKYNILGPNYIIHGIHNSSGLH